MRRKRRKDFRKEPIKLVKKRYRYPRLKPLLKKRGLTLRSVYLQMDRMRADQFSHIIGGDHPEPRGFQETLIAALDNLGIEVELKDLKTELKKYIKKTDFEIIEE